MNVIICPHCGTETERGYSVCRGCQAEVIYGARPEELGWGGIVGGAIATVLLRQLLAGPKSNLMDGYTFYVFIALTILAGMIVARIHKGNIRFFRNYKHK